MPSPRRTPRSGFTLIELLLVVVIIGVLAAIAIPKFRETKGRAYAGTLKSDLKNLASMQESYFYSNETYSSNLGALSFTGSDGVAVTISEANPRGWSASATHPAATPLVCSVYYGQAAPLPPATREGVINCQ